MDYEQMSVQDLRAECQARGLGTARAKAELIQRLTEDDARTDGTNTPAVTQEPAAGEPSVFQQTFDAEPGGPDEETHLAYRQATLAAAREAGHTPRGDARLAATRDGQWVYEVHIRRETQP